jgi:hypothetical protein
LNLSGSEFVYFTFYLGDSLAASEKSKRYRIELSAILCSEPIAVMQIVAELLGRDLAVGY